MLQPDLENTKKDLFTSLHKIKENLPHWAELAILRNGALLFKLMVSFMDL